VKKKLKDALHRFKVETFKMTHHGVEDQADVSREILEHTGQALQNAYHFHFSKDTPPHRVEMFQMIKSVALETLLPPVVEKLMRRITVLEHQQANMVRLLDELMEALSEE
jgi:chaperonin cofactor prefoldin